MHKTKNAQIKRKPIQSNTIKRYVKIKKDIINAETPVASVSTQHHSLLPNIQLSLESQSLTSIATQTDSKETYEFESKKWLNSFKFRSIKDLNKALKFFLIKHFGSNAYDTMSIQEMENLDVEFMTRLRACFELRGTHAIPTNVIWSKVRNSNRSRRYNLRKKIKL